MERGTSVHALLFGNRKVCGYPGAQRRGKDFDAFAEAHPDHEILTMSEYDKARRMADSVLDCALAQPYMQGVAEHTLRFRWMGLDCRATPDIRGEDYLTELKCSSSSEPVKFTYHALRMAYHAQMRLQQIACGKPAKDCFIVCVEDKEPHPVTVLEIDARTLELGERLLVLWAERLKGSEESGVYPPYCQSIFPLIAPEDVEFSYEEQP